MKKGQVTSGGSVAVLIFLIALFMVFYILLLAPEDRDALLNQTTDDLEDNVVIELSDVLLEQTPGVVKPHDTGTVKHKIDSVNLYIKEEPLTSDLATSLSLSKSLFSENKRQLLFNIDNLNDLDQVNLYLLVLNGKGNLVINLNGITIYETKASGLINVILPIDLLSESNVLQFSVSSPGWNIFSTNFYDLRNIKVRESYELTNTKEIRRFVLADNEKGDATLKYYIFCNTLETGARLRIFLNTEEISNAILTCVGAQKFVDIDEEELETGENNLMFEIDKGDFLINNMEIEIDSEEGGYLNYKFSITENQYDDILSEDWDVVLFMDFNDDEDKLATISVNGNEFSLDTEEIDYERIITNFVDEGNNFIKITPDNEFNIDELTIELKE